MLGGVDLIGWTDEGDLERAEIRILPVVGRFMSNPGLMRTILGKDLSGRLRAFIGGRDLTVEILRKLRSDLNSRQRSSLRRKCRHPVGQI